MTHNLWLIQWVLLVLQVLIMDEVDGMAGNEDRGGIQELIQIIKNSQIVSFPLNLYDP